jgi:hypothetical protein
VSSQPRRRRSARAWPMLYARNGDLRGAGGRTRRAGGGLGSDPVDLEAAEAATRPVACAGVPRRAPAREPLPPGSDRKPRRGCAAQERRAGAVLPSRSTGRTIHFNGDTLADHARSATVSRPRCDLRPAFVPAGVGAGQGGRRAALVDELVSPGNAGDGHRPAAGCSLLLVLPRRAGELRLRLRRAARCDAAGEPSSLAVTPFVRLGRYLPPSSRLPLRASIVGVPKNDSKRRPAALRARRGGLLHFSIALTNVSRREFRFRSCPIYVEQLSGKLELYVLNCRPMPALRPGAQAIFAMVIRVPRQARIGTNGLFWELAPRTYLPPTVGARVAVS